MTEEAALAKLAKIPADDPEAAHSRADAILITFIRKLGYTRLADAWEAVASLAYTRTRTSRTARRRELWGNLLSLALIFSSLAFTACTIMGGH